MCLIDQQTNKQTNKQTKQIGGIELEGKTITMTIASNAAAWCVACWFGSKILGIFQILNVKMLTEKG